MKMVETKIRILGIAPYEGMRAAMERTAQAFPNAQLDVYTGDLEEGVSIVEQMPPDTYSCIISRGGTADLIRQVTDLPVISIPLYVYDVLRAIKLAENYSKLYAIVGFPSITETAHTLCDLLDYKIRILTVHKAEEVQETLEQLRSENYHMVVCDMVTHTIARQMGFDAFLITSGTESLHSAIDRALKISGWFRQLRQENLFLRSITQGQNGRAVVMDLNGGIFYSSPTEPSAELAGALRAHLHDVPGGSSIRFYYHDRDLLYSITAQTLMTDGIRYALFYCIPSRIPLHSQWTGLRFLNKGECEYLLSNSFYSISGAKGDLDARLHALASARQPIMISGEPGTGKEQIARYLYLHSSMTGHPFVAADCALINEKSWDFLLEHDNSPLNASGNTIYFQNMEMLSDANAAKLLAVIQETGLARRVRLIFSGVAYENEQLPPAVQHFASRLGCLSLNLPPLRSRSDEISSLASLYLANLNLELGKQISGFEPRAVEMLRQYTWPENYTQFKKILEALAIQTSSAYIRSSDVADLLSRERTGHRNAALPAAYAEDSDPGCTLEEAIRSIVEKTVAAHGGNRAAAARQLGISRTTLWRYLGKR